MGHGAGRRILRSLAPSDGRQRRQEVPHQDRPPSVGERFWGSGQYPLSLFSNLSKQLSDSPPSVPGVVDVDSEWALKGVSLVKAKAALQRAKGELVRQGWKVTSYEESKFRNELSMRPRGPMTPSRSRRVPVTVSGCVRMPNVRAIRRPFHGRVRRPGASEPASAAPAAPLTRLNGPAEHVG